MINKKKMNTFDYDFEKKRFFDNMTSKRKFTR